MRAGFNPTKGGKLIDREECHHRIIIPVHIPHEKDYFEDAYKIFEMCLTSVIKTSVSKIKISVISNNSSIEINERLLQKYKNGKIDELIIEKEGIGKINSLLKAIRTVDERLITITDADVLFLNGWEDAVVQVFNSFPMAGAVCPVPVFRKHFDLTSNIWMKNLFSKNLYFRPVKNTEALTLFAKSLGWEWLEKEFQDIIGTIKSKDGTIAVLGCSHFVATFKKEVFEQLPLENSKYKIDGNSEFLYTDEPVLKMGGYRLATYDNYCYHLGNHYEEWMGEEYNKIKEEPKTLFNYEKLPLLKKSIFKYFLYEKIFKKILKYKYLHKKILSYKGLDKNQIYNFIEKKY